MSTASFGPQPDMTEFVARHKTIPELAVALRKREVTAVDLVEQAIDLAQSVGRVHTAVAAMAAERSADTAKRADQRLSHGIGSVLTGVPYGAKDVFAARGAPTSWGVTPLIDRVIDEDATVIERLEAQASPMVTKLVTTALAGGGGHSIPGISAQGQPKNPWDVERFAGSSSSGSAIAVALGIVPFALGTETGGSVMQPAAFCGVTGYRPTFGRIPRGGVMQLSARHDKVGILARTAEDCSLVLQVIQGPHSSDPFSLRALTSPPEPTRPLRIGVSDRELVDLDPASQDTVSAAIDEFVGIFGERSHVEVSDSHAYGVAIELIIRVEALANQGELITGPDFDMEDREQFDRLLTAAEIPATEYVAMEQVRERATDELRKIFSQVDVLISASFPTQPQRLDEPRPPRGAGTVSERLLAAVNLAGVPGVSVPCGFDSAGLPVGLHIVGPAGSDQMILALAREYQLATSHHRAHP